MFVRRRRALETPTLISLHSVQDNYALFCKYIDMFYFGVKKCKMRKGKLVDINVHCTDTEPEAQHTIM